MKDSSGSRIFFAPPPPVSPKSIVQVRLLCGPAGSGKTHHCLEAVRSELKAAPDGPPLIWLVPKQSTFQLERLLLEDPAITGYTRLQILSFERLAELVLRHFELPSPRLLDEEGRCMVLRSLLTRRRAELKLFRASARLNGFARQLSLALHEIQSDQLTPVMLRILAAKWSALEGVGPKLEDLSLLLEDYLRWLREQQLLDSGCLLTAAAQATQTSTGDHPPMLCSALWVDGFMDCSSQEWDLLASILPLCHTATLTFCLTPSGRSDHHWLSSDWIVRRNFERARDRIRQLPGVEMEVVSLKRHAAGRFSNSPVLAALERAWTESPSSAPLPEEASPALSWYECPEPEAEAICAARIILRHVRGGGRFREVAVLLRNLADYQHALVRIFSRYDIPFFLDQREAVSHHPLAELTRNALRTVVNDWQADDWFAALKSGLASAPDDEIDRLENEALARGWRGAVWKEPMAIESDPGLTDWLERLRSRLLTPFVEFERNLGTKGSKLTGERLTAAIRRLWSQLEVETRLQGWAEQDPEVPGARPPGAVHATVWTQMNQWLDTVDLAFETEALTVREWLPILEAGLGGLSVGVIPPALDQVLIGSVDRSRSLESPLVLLLGMNEGVFPARPQASAILTDADRELLAGQKLLSGGTAREQLSRERHLAYLALTRARRFLVLTSASHTEDGKALHPSPVIFQLQKLLPSLVPTPFSGAPDPATAEHPWDLLTLWPDLAIPGAETPPSSQSASSPWRLNYQEPGTKVSLPQDLVARLFGKCLKTSVSRLEQFANCPFRFFVHSGLKAEDRVWFETDFKEQGNFQHEVLARFHEELKAEGKTWSDLTPEMARDRIKIIAERLALSTGQGLWQATEESRFLSAVLTASLQDFISTIVAWMRGQYRFTPAAVEFPFGETPEAPAWALDLGDGRRLELRGRIDRIDLYRVPVKDEAFCVVVDYKSSQKKLDPIQMENGLQLQLLAYLNVLRQWPEARRHFGVERLVPAGVFYVNLQGKFDRGESRQDTLADPGQTRRMAYRHTGRFDVSSLPLLDSRPNVKAGDQFNYRLKNDGTPYSNSREALATPAFLALLDQTEQQIRNMGLEVFSGRADVDPFRHGKLTACEHCNYVSFCRIDPWTHTYRALRRADTAPQAEEDQP